MKASRPVSGKDIDTITFLGVTLQQSPGYAGKNFTSRCEALWPTSFSTVIVGFI
jgi:hypothetical protein